MSHIHHFKDIVPVGLINGGVLAFVTLADAEALLKVLLLAATLIYTCVKIYLALKGKKDE